VTADIADSLGMKKAEGALVDQPQPGSPAAKAGILAGDVITLVNETPIKNSRNLAQTIAMCAPGTSVDLSILRNGETKTVNLTLAEMPNEHEAQARTGGQLGDGVPHLGLNLAPADEGAGSGGKGVAVVGVDPNGPAAEHGMRAGDVILDVGGKSVSTPADVRDAISQSGSAGKHTVLMRVKTAQGTRFVALPIGQG
jgi:serine protease Do